MGTVAEAPKSEKHKQQTKIKLKNVHEHLAANTDKYRNGLLSPIGEEMSLNRAEWTKRFHGADPINW